MFTLADTPVKFVALLVLFAWCTVWCTYELTRRQDARQRISNAAHLAMAVVMLLMVARPTWAALTALVPTSALVAAFAVGTAWFGWLAVDGFRTADRRAGLHFCGHAAMFAAMSWHLAAMAVKAQHTTGHQDMSHGGTGHGGMGHGASGHGAQPGTTMWVFALIGVPLMTYLLAASVTAIRELTRPRVAELEQATAGAGPAVLAPAGPERGCHEVRAVGSTAHRLAASCDFAMNFGMFWMSTGLLVPILPFFTVFAF
ncbi:DUF5134 domain-containing protein [Mycolicibacterium sp. OfavD-34-C]|uniref:DUF5134 domain-containing protein n=1 Tax=Mycolicibacterium sp. OfavD-34-C TaxID=2917746 RepID=UPI001EF45801|nr:DUF5134 domain-containing protein [Mycolicibacterium sp. OfavD-34-C]MCG7583560.1 DUF5134 domain-containing protein [Mycolicibacterium sp. OfavD-34-C]